MLSLPDAFQMALQHHQAGRFQEAEALYRQILQAQPTHADALHLLGVIAHQTGKHEIAVEYITRAITLNPTAAEYHSNIGEVYRAQGKFGEAVAHYREAIALHPTYADAHCNLGIALNALGNPSAAMAHYRQALALNPTFVEAYNNLGNLFNEQGNLTEAVVYYRQALVLKPTYAEAQHNLGIALNALGNPSEAMAHYRQALALNPAYSEAHCSLGLALYAQGNLTEAMAHYRQALALKPTYAEAHNNLGIALYAQGNPSGAIAHYQKALALQPAFAEAYNNLGNVFKDQGNLTEAVAHYKKALAIKPTFIEAESQLMHQLQHLCEWAGLGDLFARQRASIRTRPDVPIPPFLLLSVPTAPAEQLACAGNWVRNSLASIIFLRESLQFYFSARTAKPLLRIGYLSSDYYEHATAYLMAELFELHDRAHFEVVAYSYGKDDGGAMRQRLAAGCDRFVDLRTTSFLEAARQIYEDRIDILVDLKGYTGGARTEIVALRPAPIQVNYLGYPGTMGAEFMDYIITDRFITPPGQEPFFAEKFVCLPDCYQINDRMRPIAEQAPTRQACGLPVKGFVFACFSSAYKITPEVFAVWMRILREVPSSVLWLYGSNSAMAANLRREAQRSGIDPARLIFARPVPRDQHLARVRCADLLLDTLPVNGHTTTSDALWAGLPVLTCAGETFASRVAGSLLTAIGLPELITHSLADYEAAALRLARDPSELAGLRRRLAKNRLTAPLFDSERFTRHLEKAYSMMWERYVSCEAPRHIEVPARPPQKKAPAKRRATRKV